MGPAWAAGFAASLAAMRWLPWGVGLGMVRADDWRGFRMAVSFRRTDARCAARLYARRG